METLLSFSGCVTAIISAITFYAASPNCRWRRWRASAWPARVVGTLLIVASAITFSAALGVGPGICAALGAWMLAFVVLPALALRAGTANADAEGA